MGSFNTSCALTHEIIDGRTDVVALMITKRPYDTRMPVHSWDIYAPVPILFEGCYDSYGRLENLKLFQSKEILSEDARKAVEHVLFMDMQTVMQGKKNPLYEERPAANLEELLMNRDISFIEKDVTLETLKEVIKMADEAKNHPPESQAVLDGLIQHQVRMNGFKDMDEMREHVKIAEQNDNTIPVSWMMFRKDAFMKLLNEFGMEDGIHKAVSEDDSMFSEDYDHNEKPAVKAQRQRQQDLRNHKSKELDEMLEFVNNFGSYSGANRPEYTFVQLIKGSAKGTGQIREDLIVLKKMHGLDITLLNDYFTLLGMTYQPSMYISESIRDYGFDEAFDMQQKLIESVKPKNKMAP
jgi:hypothetical protein